MTSMETTGWENNGLGHATEVAKPGNMPRVADHRHRCNTLSIGRAGDGHRLIGFAKLIPPAKDS